ncbi:MAG: hypothetical protein PHR25_01055 [Clostridia bacterium]|nr:hypothetical protein [Clostridia bacterium]MDD4375355.1 hypothetical protein [Clostridia bacterium]
MIDIHTHIIFDLDDGSSTIEESIAILKSAYEVGITDIILTPHYIDDGKNSYNNDGVEERVTLLKNRMQEEGIDIKIYLGNEVRDYGNIVDILEKTDAKTLADTKYMLVEFPMNNEINYIENSIYELKIRNIVPIIAHPERCYCFTKNYRLIKELAGEGVYFQVNSGSIIGRHGNEAKKIAKKMLKDGLVHFLATDTHSMKRNGYLDWEEVIKLLDKKIGRYMRKKLTIYNQRALLINEDLKKY